MGQELPHELARAVGRRFARLATNLTVGRPQLWPLVRPLVRLQFDVLAPHWDRLREPGYMAAFEAALAGVARPRRVLDVGTGTGLGAFAIADRFPEAEIVGVDLSEDMVAEARRKVPRERAGRVRFEQADASRLPFPKESFDLVTLGNMIPFFDELARVLAPGGQLLVAFSSGAGTPIYVPAQRLRAELGRRGFSEFAELAAGPGTALLARKGASG
jgi:SAM-dependent methyltransferase